MNAENPVQIDLFGVSATGTKDTRLAEHIGGYFAFRPSPAATIRDVSPRSRARAGPSRRANDTGASAGDTNRQ